MNHILRRGMRLSAMAAAIALSSQAMAAYVVNRIDYFDAAHGTANFTQLWGNNNNGQVVGVASYDNVTFFTFTYDPTTGTFTRLLQPAGFDGINNAASGIGINDAGVITGGTFEAPSTARGMIYNSGAYSFFSRPGWDQSTGRTISNPTAAFPQGLVVGYSTGNTIDPNNADGGFLYNPATSAFTAIPTSHTIGTTIPQGSNTAGQSVGSAILDGTSSLPLAFGAWGFLFTPTILNNPMAGGSVSYFRINNQPTHARGINDNGVLAAWVTDPVTHLPRVYVGTSAGFQEIVVPNTATVACATASAGAFPEGLNNAGQVTGIYADTACQTHGFIATPASLPTGTTSSGAFTFSVDVVPNVPIFIDPAVALAYDYKTGKKDPNFASVRLPLGIGNNKFVLVVNEKAYDLNAGQLFDFRAHGYRKGVDSFRVACIDPAAMLDPVNSLAFPTEVSFVAAGKFTGTQQPLTSGTGKGEGEGDDHEHGKTSTLTQEQCRAKLLNKGNDD